MSGSKGPAFSSYSQKNFWLCDSPVSYLQVTWLSQTEVSQAAVDNCV